MNPEQCQQRPDGVWVCQECGFGYELSREAVVERLAGAPHRVRRAAETVSARLDVLPRPDIWTPRQYLAHLTDWAEIIAVRVERILTEERPPLAGYDQDRLAVEKAYHTWAVPSALDRFEAATERSVRALRSARSADWERVGVRDDLNEMPVSLYANDLIHELEHHLLDVTSGPVGQGDRSASSWPI